jgi:hypothetical protein
MFIILSRLQNKQRDSQVNGQKRTHIQYFVIENNITIASKFYILSSYVLGNENYNLPCLHQLIGDLYSTKATMNTASRLILEHYLVKSVTLPELISTRLGIVLHLRFVRNISIWCGKHYSFGPEFISF